MEIFPFTSWCVLSQVKFDSVGGLSNHIRSLKEMVVFPLLYPEIFEKFKIQPPRWEVITRHCLFQGRFFGVWLLLWWFTKNIDVLLMLLLLNEHIFLALLS